jgi:hypothetical protein
MAPLLPEHCSPPDPLFRPWLWAALQEQDPDVLAELDQRLKLQQLPQCHCHHPDCPAQVVRRCLQWPGLAHYLPEARSSRSSTQPPARPGYSKNDLKRRGWTQTAIDKFLGQPDLTAPDPYGFGSTMALYDIARVEAAEQSTAFLQWQQQRAKRQQSRNHRSKRPPSYPDTS